MRRRPSVVMIRCPYRPDSESDPCEQPLFVKVSPAEKMVMYEKDGSGYPGCPASIDSVEGFCGHGALLSEDQLFEALAQQEEDRS